MLALLLLLLLGTLTVPGCCSINSPRLAVGLGTNSAGQLHATRQALEPSIS
eukprot:SAG31_NODE_11842_length_993_cov_1.233781_1_plen_50_part_10